MDHLVFLDSKDREIENLLLGNKSMIVRGAAGRKLPYGIVSEGDTLYFVGNNCDDNEIRVRGVVSSVFCTGMLTEEESFRTIISNQDRLQLPDNQFEKIAGKKYLVLIGIEKIQIIEPLRIDRRTFTKREGWVAAGNIEELIFSNQGIISA